MARKKRSGWGKDGGRNRRLAECIASVLMEERMNKKWSVGDCGPPNLEFPVTPPRLPE